MTENERCRVALVTAGAGGIGRAIAGRLLGQGFQVHVCDIDAAALRQFAGDHPAATISRADVAEPGEVDAVFDTLRERYGRLDALVNNAGIAGPTAPVEDIAPDDWNRTVAVDLNGVFYVTRRAVPLLRQSRGTIVNIASSAAFFGYPLRSPYAACKWALIGLTKTWAMELGGDGVRVNAVCPGSVSGPRIDAVIERDARRRDVTADEIRAAWSRQVSLRRFAEPEDVAATVAFLVSAEASMISGQAIGVDGHTETLSSPLD